MDKHSLLILIFNALAGLLNAGMAGVAISKQNYVWASVSSYMALMCLGVAFKMWPTRTW